jgi:hypothetical protein
MQGPSKVSDPRASEGAILATYAEVCKSYHAIDDFRMKLLSLLPFASLLGLFLLDKGFLYDAAAKGATTGAGAAREMVGFAALFPALLTLALFLYEIRGIQRTHNLITEGKHLEGMLLHISHGHFHICEEEHEAAALRGLNAKFIACLIYSLVFSGWLFIMLRFGLQHETRTCAVWAVGVGFVITGMTYWIVRKLTPA